MKHVIAILGMLIIAFIWIIPVLLMQVDPKGMWGGVYIAAFVCTIAWVLYYIIGIIGMRLN
jgi:hypothetical protein